MARFPKGPVSGARHETEIGPTRAPTTVDRGSGYGQNGFAGASSDLPGKSTRSMLDANRGATDPVLAAVIKSGTARDQDVADRVPGDAGGGAMLRNIGEGNVPVHPGMTRGMGSPSGKVPSTTGATESPLPKNPYV